MAAARKPAASSSSSSSRRRTLLIVAGVVALALVGVYLYRARQSTAAAANTSGTPGPDLTGSAAQTPSGGGASSAGSLPDSLITSPDVLQQQVQQTDGSSAQAPASLPGLTSVQASDPAYLQSLMGNPAGAHSGTVPTMPTFPASPPPPVSSSQIATHLALGRDPGA